jgi:hypothetical protein
MPPVRLDAVAKYGYRVLSGLIWIITTVIESTVEPGERVFICM